MKHQFGIRGATLAATFLLLSPTLAEAQRVRAERTEMSRALRNCGRALAFGTIVGGIAGALIGGRRNRAEGLAIGAGAGAGVGGIACAILIANAERQERIIAAQRLAAAGPVGQMQTQMFDDGKGGSLQIVSRAEEVTPTARLVQVRFQTAAGEQISPALGAGTPVCRRVHSDMVSSEGSGALPAQLYCRTPEGDYAPYHEAVPRRARRS